MSNIDSHLGQYYKRSSIQFKPFDGGLRLLLSVLANFGRDPAELNMSQSHGFLSWRSEAVWEHGAIRSR